MPPPPLEGRVKNGPPAAHGTARKKLGRAGTARTSGSCRTEILGTTGCTARPKYWAVPGPARPVKTRMHKNSLNIK
uniref:Uncharacterized protein n=1 Tax=Arundo donax TaxID=35708 RepID=A0A0A9ACK8_ARUDO